MRYLLSFLCLLAVACTTVEAVEYRPLILGADGKPRQFPDGNDYQRIVPVAGLDAAIPAAAVANTGLLYIATDTLKIYRSTGSVWQVLSYGGLAAQVVGSSANANGMTVSGGYLVNLEPASASFPGVVTTGTQTFAGAKTFSAVVAGPTATTATASFNAPHGVAPTSPTNGDIWTTTSGLFSRINGATVGPFGAGGGITGTLVSGRVPYSDGTSSVTDSAKMVFSATTGLNVNMASSGLRNTMVGTSAGDSMTTGTDSVYVGANAGTADNAGSENVGVGSSALENAAGTSGNTAVGFSALPNIADGGNTAVGSNIGPTLTSGDANTFIGANTAGNATSGTANIFLGFGAGDSTAATASQRFVVGSGGASINSVFIGKGEVHSSPTGTTIGTTGGSGTDVAGAPLNFAGGISTGSGVGGSVIIRTSAASGSSSTPNTLADRLTINQLGQVIVNTVGRGLSVKEGSDAKMGVSVLVAGTVTVSTTAVTATSRIFLTSQADGGTVGFQRVSARTAATSFTITSSNGADTSTIAWFIVEPSP